MSELDRACTLRSGVVLSGRIALAPLTNTQSHADGTLSQVGMRWLVARAAGGFPWVSTCATFVCEEGHAWAGQLGISTDAHVPDLTTLASALRAYGSRGVVQLHHGGAQASLAPTRLSTVDGENQRAATEADLARVTEQFVAAALRAHQAGFDGVEIHGANGYLFTHEFTPFNRNQPEQVDPTLLADAVPVGSLCNHVAPVETVASGRSWPWWRAMGILPMLAGITSNQLLPPLTVVMAALRSGQIRSVRPLLLAEMPAIAARARRPS